MFTDKHFSGGYSYRVFTASSTDAASSIEVPFVGNLKSLPKHIIRDAANMARVNVEFRKETLLLSSKDPEDAGRAQLIMENIPDKFGKVEYTHFISIPLGMSEAVEAFQDRAQCLNPDLDTDAFINPKKFHLTLFMLKLSSDKDMNAAKEILESFPLEQAKKIQISLLGLGVMKGTEKACRVLYAKVKANKQLSELGRNLQTRFAAAGMVHDFRPITWHATLINVRYSKQPDYEFDASEIIEAHKSTEFGRPLLTQIHLSSLSQTVDRDTGYYHCDFQLKL